MAVNRTYGNLAYNSEEKFWEITEAEPHVCIKLKAIFPVIPKGGSQPFTFPGTTAACADLEWFMGRYPLAITPDDLKRIKRGRKKFQDDINDLESILLPGYKPIVVTLNPGCAGRNYQLVGKDVYIAS